MATTHLLTPCFTVTSPCAMHPTHQVCCGWVPGVPTCRWRVAVRCCRRAPSSKIALRLRRFGGMVTSDEHQHVERYNVHYWLLNIIIIVITCNNYFMHLLSLLHTNVYIYNYIYWYVCVFTTLCVYITYIYIYLMGIEWNIKGSL